MLQEAVDQKILPRNVAYDIKLFRETPKSPDTFDSAELRKLFPASEIELMRVWKSFSWAVFFRVMAVGGLRPGEVAALHWGDFYPQLCGLSVSKAIESGSRAIKGLKTEAKGVKAKPCLLDDTSIKQLVALRMAQGQPNELELIFTVPATGAVIDPSTSNKVFRGALKRSGLDTGKTQYGLRHTFQTNALNKLHRDAVADMMGHTAYNATYDQRSGEMLLQKYQAMREAVIPDFARGA
ncbi:MAG: tyrosine-type recombinase/integrase [Spirochaetota bacterium]